MSGPTEEFQAAGKAGTLAVLLAFIYRMRIVLAVFLGGYLLWKVGLGPQNQAELRELIREVLPAFGR